MNQRWHSHNQQRGTTSNALISPREESVTCSDSGKINCFLHCCPTPHKWALKIRSESCPAFHPSRCPCVNPGDKKAAGVAFDLARLVTPPEWTKSPLSFPPSLLSGVELRPISIYLFHTKVWGGEREDMPSIFMQFLNDRSPFKSSVYVNTPMQPVSFRNVAQRNLELTSQVL